MDTLVPAADDDFSKLTRAPRNRSSRVKTPSRLTGS
jgi:hypothetical protein